MHQQINRNNLDHLNAIIQKFLARNSIISNPQQSWELRKSELGGVGVFAKRDIEVGEVIFKDFPVILGPRAAPTCSEVCVACYTRNGLKLCGKGCGLKLCCDGAVHQKECKLIRQWKKKDIDEELSKKFTKVLTPIRSLLLSEEDREVVLYLKAHRSDQHGFEVDVMKDELGLDVKEDEEAFMRFVCSVLDANAFEVITGNEDNQSSIRGLYPLGSLANHSCTPNAIHVFDDAHLMIVRASIFIPKGTEICHSYSRLIWGTPTRRFHLFRTKHFLCKCPRCLDGTEFGTYMSSIRCKLCKSGLLIATHPAKFDTKWQCEQCQSMFEAKDVARTVSLLGSALNSFGSNDLTFMMRFITEKLPGLVSDNHEAVMEMQYKIVWILGYNQGFAWKDLTDELLKTKETFCRNILKVFGMLRLGQCKGRGLFLYELYCTLREIRKRDGCSSDNASKIEDPEMKNLINEAADILMFDVSAPLEIKQKWAS